MRTIVCYHILKVWCICSILFFFILKCLFFLEMLSYLFNTITLSFFTLTNVIRNVNLSSFETHYMHYTVHIKYTVSICCLAFLNKHWIPQKFYMGASLGIRWIFLTTGLTQNFLSIKNTAINRKEPEGMALIMINIHDWRLWLWRSGCICCCCCYCAFNYNEFSFCYLILWTTKMGNGWKLKRLGNVFNFLTRHIPEKSTWIAFPGKIHLIVTFWFTRNVLPFWIKNQITLVSFFNQ